MAETATTTQQEDEDEFVPLSPEEWEHENEHANTVAGCTFCAEDEAFAAESASD